MSKPANPLAVLALLKEAIYLPLRDAKLVLPIFLLVLLPCKLVGKFNPIPLKIHLSSLLPSSYDIPKEFKSLLEVDLTGEFLWWLTFTSGISSFSIASVTKPSSLAELLRTVRRKWKRIAITSFLVLLFSYTYISCLAILSFLNGSLKRNAALLFVRITSVLSTVVFVLVNMGCHLSIVVSSVEEGCDGLSAVRRARELMRGREFRGFALMGLLIFLDFLQGDENNEAATIMVVLGKSLLELVLLMFSSTICAVFYLDCRKGKGERRSLL